MSRSISGGGSRGRSQAIYFLAKQLKGKDAYWAHHQALENGGSFHFKFPLKQLSFFKILIPDQDFFELNCINLQIGVAVHIYIKVHKV